MSCFLSTCPRNTAWLCSVWYHERDNNRQTAAVVAVDVMHPPPSYCIRLEGADSPWDMNKSHAISF